MQKLKINRCLLFTVVIFAILLRWMVALYPYSGHNTPPMFGDYEAQRHWMEITNKLPIKEWYINSTDNNLLYWGLDYPPLTAYHMYLSGIVAQEINEDFIELKNSRGYESDELKLFMRMSVLLGDLLIFIPAVVLYAMSENNFIRGLSSRLDKRFKSNQFITSVSIFLLYPGLILIDHGHFQYNSISLGLFLGAFVAIKQRHEWIGTFLFCLALNYKQMELYHAIPLFLYLLGNSLGLRIKSTIVELLMLTVVVCATFILIWYPFYDAEFSTIQSVVLRIFPVSRGLFEDKVSNFWCSMSVFVKFKNIFDVDTLIKLSGITTLLMALPSGLHLFINPTISNLSLSLFNVSMSFFLFSFQVHEKSVLLCAIPACILFLDYPAECFWFLFTSVVSMFPLFAKDGLSLAVFPLLLMFYCLFVHIMQSVDFSCFQVPSIFYSLTQHINKWLKLRFWKKLSIYVSMLGSLTLCLTLMIGIPPAKYPDLFPVCISLYSSLHFIYFFLLFSAHQLFGSKAIGVTEITPTKKKT